MATIHNSKVQERLIKEADIQLSVDEVPTQLARSIVPVMICNPQNTINVTKGEKIEVTGMATLYTTPSDKDFYLCSVYLNNQSDSTCDNTTISLVGTVKGGTADELIRFQKITTTAFVESSSMNYNNPILLERGSSVTFGSSFSAGVSHTGACLSGYTIDSK